MRYFTFKWINLDSKGIIAHGQGIYYTNATLDLNEIKNIVMSEIAPDPSTSMIVPLTNEIDYEAFVSLGGDPNMR